MSLLFLDFGLKDELSKRLHIPSSATLDVVQQKSGPKFEFLFKILRALTVTLQLNRYVRLCCTSYLIGVQCDIV